jgi:integrase
MKTATAPLPPLRSVKVLDQLRERIRYLHYSLRTEQAYVHWVRAFIRFHGVRHPATLGSSEVEAFLSWLANERKVSVSTHRQALAALLFFYGKVLCTDLPWLQEIGRPRPSRRLPVVLTPDEVVRILGFLEGEHRLFAQLLYGTGMRISEGLQLRVKDLDFDHGTIIVREGKGSKDRALMLPESLAPSLREQLSRARAWWLKDQAEGRSGVALPTPLSGSIRAPGIPGGETTLRYKVNGSAEMTEIALVRARSGDSRCGASPPESLVRESSATVVSTVMCIPFMRSSRIRRLPWRCRSLTILEQTMAMRKRDDDLVFPQRGGYRRGGFEPLGGGAAACHE